ncbi:MAG: hypothetical protein RL190_2151 [Actinomycetota bacterium]
MGDRLVCGIDVGSSAVKATLLHPERGVVATGDAPAPLRSEHPGWSEVAVEDWWAAACAAVPLALADAGAVAADVVAVATTGMVPAVVLLDEAGGPLRAGILQNDARAVGEISEMEAALADVDLLGRTGSALTQQSVGPTLLWIRRNEPDVWARTATVGGSYDWLLRRLGAIPHVEGNWAIESGLYDLSGRPCPEVLAVAGVESSRLPAVVRPATPMGEIDPAAAAAIGLAPGTLLVVGGADHVLSAASAGVAEPGQALVKLGSSGDLLTVSCEPVTDRRLYLDHHPIQGRWIPNGCMATSGSLLRWFQQRIAAGEDFAALDAEAAQVPAGAEGVVCLPYFLGEKSPVHDPEARGAFVGLHLGHTRAHLFRACLESTGHGLRHHLDVLEEIGIEVREARVTNGGANSRLWKQAVADALGIPLVPIIDHPGSSFGAAVAAAIGAGLIDGWEAVDRFVDLGDPVEPDPRAAPALAESYGVYRDLEAALRPLSHRLARAAR